MTQHNKYYSRSVKCLICNRNTSTRKTKKQLPYYVCKICRKINPIPSDDPNIDMKRSLIAHLLAKGKSYSFIKTELRCGNDTISKISKALSMSNVIEVCSEHVKEQEKKKKPFWKTFFGKFFGIE